MSISSILANIIRKNITVFIHNFSIVVCICEYIYIYITNIFSNVSELCLMSWRIHVKSMIYDAPGPQSHSSSYTRHRHYRPYNASVNVHFSWDPWHVFNFPVREKVMYDSHVFSCAIHRGSTKFNIILVHSPCANQSNLRCLFFSEVYNTRFSLNLNRVTRHKNIRIQLK